MPSALAPTNGRVISNVASAPEEPRALARCGRARACARACRGRRAGSPSGTRTSSSTSSAVCEARMPSLSSFLPMAKPGRALLDDERGLAAVAERGVDGGDDDVDVGDAAVGDEDLGAVEDPLVAVALARWCAASLTSEPAPGLGDRVGAELDLVAEAVALAAPSDRSARACPRRRCRRRPATTPGSPARCRRSPSAAPRRR